MISEDERRDFTESFRLGDLEVVRGAHWCLSLRPAQPVLGSLVLSSLGREGSFAEAAQGDGGPELLELLSLAERAAKACFGAVRINVLALMMKDPLVHFHVLPRYSDPSPRFGVDWRDAGWPGPPSLEAQDVGDEVLVAIRDAYRAWIAEDGAVSSEG